MGKIYFVRHGESEWNVTDQICGQTDVPLTEKGHKQAEETGKNIVESGISADLILCSPLLRAKPDGTAYRRNDRNPITG